MTDQRPTDEQIESFLEALRSTGNEAAARRESGLKRDQVRALKDDDDAFAAACQEAIELWRFDVIEDPIRRRAVEGYQKDIFWDGQVVGTETVYSDRLLALMAKAHVPAYRDQLEIKDTTPRPLDLEKLPEDAREKLREALRAGLQSRKPED